MDIEKFLKIIAHAESSDGKNLNHRQMQSGIHEGHKAIGTYGLMPNTVNEIINRMRANNQADESLLNLQKLSPYEMKQKLEQNPELERRLANSLAERVLQRQGGDAEKAAFSWNHGHNLTPERIEQKDYKNSDYVKKFKKIMESLGE